jgi:hypothetical protein
VKQHFALCPSLPPLLFITNTTKLSTNIGEQAVTQIATDLGNLNGALIADFTAELVNNGALQPIRERLRASSNLQGVVIIGGHDVVPTQSVDCLSSDLRQKVSTISLDADDFILWSDDAYASQDDTYLPTLPVSRIPDGRSKELVIAALYGPGEPGSLSRFGLRNIARPNADDVYSMLHGQGNMLISTPTTPQSIQGGVAGDTVYMWLHGEWWDGTRFWGEDGGGRLIEAVNTSNVRRTSIVLSCACWGGLHVNIAAGRLSPQDQVSSIDPRSSMALMFLLNGANAYIGCTGAHYYPNGAPLHAEFWKRLIQGVPASKSLFQSKVKFLSDIPHGHSGDLQTAVELKTWREFTCLGLGW